MAKFETIEIIDNDNLKNAIRLVRTLKYEIIELQKKGLSKKVINKILLKKYTKKNKNYF